MEDAGPELALRKLTQTFGVTGYVILNKNGIPIQSHGMTEERAVHFAGIFSELVLAAQMFLSSQKKNIDPSLSDSENELSCLRLRSYKSEYVICPEEHYTLIVVHNPNYVQPEIKVDATAAAASDGEARPGTAA